MALTTTTEMDINSAMILDVIPFTLLSNNSCTQVLEGGLCHIFKKELDKDLLNKNVYISTSLIIYIKRGCQTIKSSNGEKQFLEEGSLNIFRKDLYHVSDYKGRNGLFQAYLFFIPEDIVDKYFPKESVNISYENIDRKQGVLSLDTPTPVKNLIESIDSIYKKELSNKSITETKIVELLLLIKACISNIELIQWLKTDEVSYRKRDMKKFMEENLYKNLKVSDYAQLTGRSTTSFIGEFKKLYGVTPNQWLIEKRLERARYLLKTCGASVTEAAYEVGYENISHFIKSYKRKYDTTPQKDKELILSLRAKN